MAQGSTNPIISCPAQHESQFVPTFRSRLFRKVKSTSSCEGNPTAYPKNRDSSLRLHRSLAHRFFEGWGRGKGRQQKSALAERSQAPILVGAPGAIPTRDLPLRSQIHEPFVVNSYEKAQRKRMIIRC